MITIKEGGVYKASKIMSGSTEKGDWELISVTDESGKNSVSLFAKNIPSGVSEGQNFRVERICSVTSKNKQDKNGVWRTNVSVDADIAQVEE